jgi:methionyl-tRNA formyltransferase
MDTGPILASERTEILPDETHPELEARLAEIGATLLLRTVPAYVDKRITPVPQGKDGATVCQLIDRSDGRVVWSDDAETINNRFRALLPWPGLFTYWKRDDGFVRLKLHHISLLRQTPQIKKRLGEVFEIGDSIGVQSGSGVILLNDVQLEGKERQSIGEFRRGYPDIIGTILQ